MLTVSQLKIGAGSGLTISDTHIMGKSQGAIMTSVKAGYIWDLIIERCLITGDPDLPNVGTLNWGGRFYNLRGDCALLDNVIRNIPKEHGAYFGSIENLIIRGLAATDIGSQLLQFAAREYECFGGLADNRPGRLLVENVRAERIATNFGRRPSWNLSFFAFQTQRRDANGELVFNAGGAAVRGAVIPSKTDVVLNDWHIKGYGFEHTASGNRQCNSTGAILVQDGDYFELGRSEFDFVRPDREIIQIKNRKNIVVKPIMLKGGDLVLHDCDNSHIRIHPGAGNGEIRRRKLGSHTTTYLSTIKKGYSQ